MDGSEASTELLNRLFPASNTSRILLPLEAKSLITQFEIAKAKEKEVSEIKDEASNKLKAILGENETGIYEDRVVSWKSVSTEKFDAKKLQEQEPDVYKKYLTKSTYRRFSIK
jgi:predicted phage-related endonuclease